MKYIKIKHLLFSVLALVIIKLSFYLIDVNFFNKLPEFIELKRRFNLETNLFLKEKSLLQIILVVSIFIPVFEELLFRSWLILNNKSISLFISTIPILILKIYKPDILWYFMLLLNVLLGFCFYCLSLKLLKKVNFEKFNSKYFVNFSIIFSSIVFGGFHLFNYANINIYVLVLIIPHILSGFVYAFLRIKNGILWSMFLHIINNSPVILVFIIHKF